MDPAENKKILHTPLGDFNSEEEYREAHRVKLEAAREHLRKIIPPGRSLVDELIAERREEARLFWSKA